MDLERQFPELTELGHFGLDDIDFECDDPEDIASFKSGLREEFPDYERAVKTRFAFATTPIVPNWRWVGRMLRQAGWRNLGNRRNANTGAAFIALWWKEFPGKGTVTCEQLSQNNEYPASSERFDIPEGARSSDFCCGLQMGEEAYTPKFPKGLWKKFPYLQLLRLIGAPRRIPDYKRIASLGNASYWTNAGRNYRP